MSPIPAMTAPPATQGRLARTITSQAARQAAEGDDDCEIRPGCMKPTPALLTGAAPHWAGARRAPAPDPHSAVRARRHGPQRLA